ncbi:MAG: glycosyltransferase family 4 protein [Chloroflexi bacterium]|nr:glycosyltransferase family 4 protein [Chloroflexota bacterium]
MKKKLCYVLPNYDPLIAEHYFHIYEFLEDVSHLMDVFLVVERAAKPPAFTAVKRTYVLRFATFILGLLERLLTFTVIRLKGYRTFYVHQSYSSAIAASLVTRLLGGQTLYWHCGLKKEYMSRWALSWSAIRVKLLDDYAFLLSIRLVKFLVTGSETMRQYYATSFGLKRSKIKVMPNWVNLERFRPDEFKQPELRREMELGANSKVVAFIHWLSPRKGTQYLVRIFQEVSRQIPDVCFLIVGDGPYRETLEREIEENGLAELVRLVGSVPNQEVAKYYAVADLLIMPSDEEGFPRVLIEAMAMGVPFVATDVGSVREMATERQNRYVVPKGDMAAFTDKLVSLLQDDKRRMELREDGLYRVQDYTKEKVVEIFTSEIVV